MKGKVTAGDLIALLYRFRGEGEDVALPIYAPFKGRMKLHWFTCFIDEDDGKTTIRVNRVFMYDGKLSEWKGDTEFSTFEPVNLDVDLDDYVSKLLSTKGSYNFLKEYGQAPLIDLYRKVIANEKK